MVLIGGFYYWCASGDFGVKVIGKTGAGLIGGIKGITMWIFPPFTSLNSSTCLCMCRRSERARDHRVIS